MSEGPERLRKKAADRLLGAQQEALHATSRALDAEGGNLNEDTSDPGQANA